MSGVDRGAGVTSWLPAVPDLTELVRGSTVSLAVTGLSRAGKTVFVTSLVHNLLSTLHQPHRLPLLRVVSDGRLIAARLADTRADRLPRFPYERNIEHMAASPETGRRAPPTSARSRSTSRSCRAARSASCSAGSAAALPRCG